MATASAKVQMKGSADARINAAVKVIAAHLHIEALKPVTGRFTDAEMRGIRQREMLASFLESVAEKLKTEPAEQPAGKGKGK